MNIVKPVEHLIDDRLRRGVDLELVCVREQIPVQVEIAVVLNAGDETVARNVRGIKSVQEGILFADIVSVKPFGDLYACEALREGDLHRLGLSGKQHHYLVVGESLAEVVYAGFVTAVVAVEFGEELKDELVFNEAHLLEIFAYVLGFRALLDLELDGRVRVKVNFVRVKRILVPVHEVRVGKECGKYRNAHKEDYENNDNESLAVSREPAVA